MRIDAIARLKSLRKLGHPRYDEMWISSLLGLGGGPQIRSFRASSRKLGMLNKPQTESRR
jgi:hypothetical protein